MKFACIYQSSDHANNCQLFLHVLVQRNTSLKVNIRTLLILIQISCTQNENSPSKVLPRAAGSSVQVLPQATLKRSESLMLQEFGVGINASYGEVTKICKIKLAHLLFFDICCVLGTLVVISRLFRFGILSTRKKIKSWWVGHLTVLARNSINCTKLVESPQNHYQRRNKQLFA